MTWVSGKPKWKCAICGRANIYHDPKTGKCPDPTDTKPKVK